MIHLIKLWLKSPISENRKIAGGKGNGLGTPQGGVCPLLANIYMNLIDKAVQRVGGIFQSLGIKIVRYADDFVLMGRVIPGVVITRLKGLLDRMELTLNEEKTKLVHIRKEKSGFQFLGFAFRYNKDIKGRATTYLHIGPSPKSVKKCNENIRETLDKRGHASPANLVKVRRSQT